MHFSANTIIDILPRRSLLAREGHGKTKNIAANIDVICIVMSPPPVLSEYLIDRYLVAAELLKIEPLIVLNKMDLLDEETKTRRWLASSLIRLFLTRLFSPVFMWKRLSLLADHMKAGQPCWLGPQVLANLPSLLHWGIMLPFLSVKFQKGAGRHTTTATRLYHLPAGGQLIDSQCVSLIYGNSGRKY